MTTAALSGLPPPGTDTSLAQMFFDRSAAAGTAAALRVRRGEGYVDVSFKAYRDRVADLAAGLVTIDGGLAAGTCVGIFASTRLEWLCVDFAVLSLGCITVPIYASVLGPEAGYLHTDAAIEVVVVEGKAQLDKVRAFRDGFTFLEKSYPKSAVKLRKIIVIDPSGIDPAADWESLKDLEERGRSNADETAAVRKERLAAQKRSDVATYCYTSGTTGAPKGVIHTNENWLTILDIAGEMGIFTIGTRKTGVFLFLPMAHAFGRLIAFGAAYFQSVVVLSSIETLLEDLTRSRPGFVPSAPRMYEKMYAKLMSTVTTAPLRRQKIFAAAMAVGKKTIPYRQNHQALPPLLKLQNAIADRLVFSKLRARLGLDRTEAMLTGSAPIAPSVQEFFYAIGLTLIEAYGLTETTPGISANTPQKWKMGTVGPLLSCVTLKFAEDGEICVKGKNVTSGYLNRPEATAEAFDADGWFHTGDIGALDSDGFLRITDRKKDLLKTSGGKYIAPQKIEGLLKARPLIAEAVVIGDNRNFCTVLLVVDDEALKTWAEQNGHPNDREAATTRAFLQQQVDAVNADLASYETLKHFRVVPEPFTVENHMLTPSFKVKRKAVSTRWSLLIEEMYEKPRSRT